MPTAKPRVQVTLTRSSYEVLGRIAQARRISKSAVLSELFEAARPAMEKVAELLEVAAVAPKDTLQRFSAALQSGEDRAESLVAEGLGQMDLLLHGLRNGVPWGESAQGDARAARTPAPSSTPVSVTRGSGRHTRDDLPPRKGANPLKVHRRGSGRSDKATNRPRRGRK